MFVQCNTYVLVPKLTDNIYIIGCPLVKLPNCLTKNLTLAETLPHERILPAPQQSRHRELEGSEAMMSLASRRGLLAVVAPRYRTAQAAERTRILEEFVASTGYHRKDARVLLNHPLAKEAAGRTR